MATDLSDFQENGRVSRILTVFLMPAVLVVFCAPQARADAATPFIMGGMPLHLFMGNFVIGVIEGIIISRVFLKSKTALRTMFQTPILSSPVAIMVVANYVSAWLGFVLTSSLSEQLGLTVENYLVMRWVVVGLLYAATLVIEWPFVAFCLRRRERWLVKSVTASLLVQTITYGLLCAYYAAVGYSPLFREVTVVPLAEISVPPDLALSYISESDARRHLYTFSTHADSLMPRPDFTPYWDKAAEGVQAPPPPFFHCYISHPKGAAGDWKFETGIWQWGGITAWSQSTQETVDVGMENPVANWRVRQAAYVPVDKVVFQFGDRQICLLDPADRRLALVAIGRDPILVRAPGAPAPATP